jgi:predicted ABC-type ATPase
VSGDRPQAIVIAGPNGSGKSTAAAVLLPPELTFINADMIAQDLSGEPGSPGDIQAGRILLARVQVLESLGDSFALETTLAPKILARRVDRWREDGYETHLFFFWLPDEELAIQRVRQRAQDGGHPVPEETIRRRFRAGLRNFFEAYAPKFDTWRLYDNSTLEPKLVARRRRGEPVRIMEEETWRSLAANYGAEGWR